MSQAAEITNSTFICEAPVPPSLPVLKVLADSRLCAKNSQQITLDPRLTHESIEAITSIQPGVAILERISGLPDFLPSSFLTKGVERSSAVVRIVVRDQSGEVRGYGTGFVCAPGMVMTNNHVLQDANVARYSTAEFFHEIGFTPISVRLLPEEFFVTNEDLDFSIVAFDKSLHYDVLSKIKHVPMRQDPTMSAVGDAVNIIQHPNGRPKEIAIHNNKILAMNADVIHYETDTEPGMLLNLLLNNLGSSGSPVFNNNWDLVALHHAGRVDRDANGKVTVKNEGIRIQRIIYHLRSNIQTNRKIQRVLNHVESWSPNYGLFGIESETVKPLSGVGYWVPKTDIGSDYHNEVSLTSFTGTLDYADVGSWNIEHFNNRVSDERVSKVAEVIKQMNMDVLGLVEVEDGALNRLKKQLERDQEYVDYIYLDTKNAQDLAIMYDKKTTSVKKVTEFDEEFTDQAFVVGRIPLIGRCKVIEQDKSVEFFFIVVHLKAMGDPTSQVKRHLAMQQLAAAIKKIQDKYKLPVVCAGDYNEPQVDRLLSGMGEDVVYLTVDDTEHGDVTYVKGNRRSLLDHLVVTQDAIIHQAGTIDDAVIVRYDKIIPNYVRDISDHVPVVTRLVYNNATAHGEGGDGGDDIEFTFELGEILPGDGDSVAEAIPLSDSTKFDIAFEVINDDDDDHEGWGRKLGRIIKITHNGHTILKVSSNKSIKHNLGRLVDDASALASIAAVIAKPTPEAVLLMLSSVSKAISGHVDDGGSSSAPNGQKWALIRNTTIVGGDGGAMDASTPELITKVKTTTINTKGKAFVIAKGKATIKKVLVPLKRQTGCDLYMLV